jgi:hypothetical protein
MGMKFIITIFIIFTFSYVFSNPKEKNDLHWTQKIFIKENNLNNNNEINVNSDLVNKNNNFEESSNISDEKNEIGKNKTEQ